jgi:hypothetical protein
MATKILNFNETLAANATQIEATPEGGITPLAGLTWTLVEVRPYFTGKGDLFIFLDDQQYIQVASEDVATYGKPVVCAIQVKQPSAFHAKFSDRSGASNFVGVDLVIEETSGTAAPGA